MQAEGEGGWEANSMGLELFGDYRMVVEVPRKTAQSQRLKGRYKSLVLVEICLDGLTECLSVPI